MADASARNYKEYLAEALHMFKCCKDNDVQEFLNNKAIEFEKRGWATTYLLLDHDKFIKNILKVEGYFSLTHKAVIFDENVSGTTKNRLSGTKSAECESFVLIGQLGKYQSLENGKIISSSITSNEILHDALDIIAKASDYIVSRNIIIECKPIEKVQKIYSDFGFVELQFDGELHTMYLKIDHTIEF